MCNNQGCLIAVGKFAAMVAAMFLKIELTETDKAASSGAATTRLTKLKSGVWHADVKLELCGAKVSFIAS